MSSNQDFSNKILLVEFDFDGVTYYIGTEGFASENYYQPIMTTASTIQIGSSSGGYMSVNFGNITISNDPKDKNAPFNLHTGSFAKLLNNPNKLIPVRVYWGKQKTALFEGTMYFSNMKEDKMSFVLEALDLPQNALVERATDNQEDTSDLGDPLASGGNFLPSFTSFAVDFTVALENWSTTSTADNALKLTFNQAHGLSVGQIIFVDFVPTDGTDNVDDNINLNNLVRWTLGDGTYIKPLGSMSVETAEEFVVTVKPSHPIGSNVGTPNIQGYWTVYNFPSQPAPWFFGLIDREPGLLKHPDTDDTKYWNPLNHTDTANYIRLYDDGVLVGTNDPSDVDTTIADSTDFWKLSFVKNELETFKQGFPVTAMYGNGIVAGNAMFPALYVGDAVTIEGSGIASFNGTFQVSQVTSNNHFRFLMFEAGDEIRDSPDAIITDNAPRVGKQITRFGNYFLAGRVPTSDYIFTRESTVEDGVTNIVGEPLVSGMGRDGETLYDFFTWCLGELDVSTLNSDLAPDLATKKISVAVNSQIKVTDLMGKIAESTNHLCYIRDDTLYVVDLGYESVNFVSIPSYEIINASVDSEYPISFIETSFTKKVVYDDEWPITTQDENEKVRVDNVSVGSSEVVDAVSKVAVDNRKYLQAILNHRKKAKMSLTVNDVNLNYSIGTRVKFSREEEQISYDMIIDNISYNFKNLQTQFSGRGTISVIEREGIFT